MDIQLLTARDAVLALAPEWAELHRRDTTSTPFTSPWWGTAWLKHLGGAAEPWVVTVRAEGELVGLAPLVRLRRGGLRILRVIGKEPADYWDILALPSSREEVALAVAGLLADRSRDWDQLVLDCLPPLSPTLPLLSADSRFSVRPREVVPCPGFDLPGTFEAYLERLSGKRRTKMRRHLRRVDDGEVRLVTIGDADAVPAAMKRWQDLRLRQWEDRPGRIMPLHRTDAFREFLVQVATDLIPEGLASIWEFHVDGEVVGSYLNFSDSTTFYNYLGGFDPGSQRLRLGTIAVLLGIRESIEAKRDYFDFLVGAEEYKYEFGAANRELTSVAVANRRIRSRMALHLASARDRIRKTGEEA